MIIDDKITSYNKRKYMQKQTLITKTASQLDDDDQRMCIYI